MIIIPIIATAAGPARLDIRVRVAPQDPVIGVASEPRDALLTAPRFQAFEIFLGVPKGVSGRFVLAVAAGSPENVAVCTTPVVAEVGAAVVDVIEVVVESV